MGDKSSITAVFPLSLMYLFFLPLLVLGVAAEDVFSVECSGSVPPACHLVGGVSSQALAYGSFDDAIEETGLC